jgi:hypothetical protein
MKMENLRMGESCRWPFRETRPEQRQFFRVAGSVFIAGLFVLAAKELVAMARKTIEASWRLKEAINSLGAEFPEYAKQGHYFEMSLVLSFHKPPKGRGFDIWKAIFTRLEQAEKNRR